MYYGKHKDILNAKNREHYHNNLAYYKQYNIAHKEERTAKAKVYRAKTIVQRHNYYIANKKPLTTAQKARKALNKKQWIVKNKTKLQQSFDCPCGGHYKYCRKSKHFKTKKHMAYVAQAN